MASNTKSARLHRACLLAAVSSVVVGSWAFAQNATAPVPRGGNNTPSAATTNGSGSAMDGLPTSTSASFGDWTMRCQRMAMSGTEQQNVCEVVYQVRAQDQQNPVAEIAIGRLKKSDPLTLTAVLPVNTTFPNAPTFSADAKGGEPVELTWRKCLPGGCFAETGMKDDVLRRWRSQSAPARLVWKDASGRDFTVSISFRGLSQALDALAKESS